MNIIISNASHEPLYQQIVTQIKNQIIRGQLTEGSALPSIRNLAKELHISVITTKRAYDELEREGYIVSVVGKGSYVASQNKELIREKQLKIIEDKLIEVIMESRVLNIGLIELKNMMEVLYGEVE